MPWRAAYADNFELKQKFRIMFKAKVSCGRKWSHSLAGYFGLAVKRHVIKCALNVWIARAYVLRLWKWGATSCYLIFFLRKSCLRLHDASFSRMLWFRLCPLVVSMDSIDIVASCIFAALWLFVGIACMIIVS